MGNTASSTHQTDADVTAFLETVADEQQRADAYSIIEIMSHLSQHPPKMWSSSIIGFGRYHYKYESGREGDMPRLSFSPRKGQTVLYITDGYGRYAELIARLGKYKVGKACLYIKRLSDIDETVLEQLCVASLGWMRENYPDSA